MEPYFVWNRYQYAKYNDYVQHVFTTDRARCKEGRVPC